MPTSLRFVIRSAAGLLTIGFLALFALIGATTWLNERARINFDDVAAAREIRSAATELRDALRTAESSQRAYVFTGNEIYLAPYDAAKAQVSRQVGLLGRVLPQDAHNARIFSELERISTEKLTEMDDTITSKKQGRDAEALSLFRSNRGKALMDEANVFLTSIILSADERLTNDVSEQRANTSLLRWISLVGSVVIVFVVAIVLVTVTRYTQEIRQARDEVHALNAGLEERVKLRTADLAGARDRAEILLTEVNHRVSNSLTLVASLVKLQSNALTDARTKEALAETQGRIHAISLLHRSLYSANDPRHVAVDDYLTRLLEHLETSMRADGHTATLRFDITPIKLPTDAAINLGVVVTEWVTNAFKYAYPEHAGEIRVRLIESPDARIELVVDDDGVGRGAEVAPKGTGLGGRIVRAMAAAMKAEVEYKPRQPGTSACFAFVAPSTVEEPRAL